MSATAELTFSDPLASYRDLVIRCADNHVPTPREAHEICFVAGKTVVQLREDAKSIRQRQGIVHEIASASDRAPERMALKTRLQELPALRDQLTKEYRAAMTELQVEENELLAKHSQLLHSGPNVAQLRRDLRESADPAVVAELERLQREIAEARNVLPALSEKAGRIGSRTREDVESELKDARQTVELIQDPDKRSDAEHRVWRLESEIRAMDAAVPLHADAAERVRQMEQRIGHLQARIESDPTCIALSN